jgi:Fic family protein
MTEPTGQYVKQPEGYSAFVPDPLPPELKWTAQLVRALSDADRAIGRLAGEGRRLPNPHVLMRPFIAREAVLSSRIEGTQATLGELLAAAAGAVVDRSPEDLHEVANYVTALEYGIERLKRLPLSLRLIKEIHERLLEGVRGESARPGEIRDVQNWIGVPGSTPHTATYVPPPSQQVLPALEQLERFLNERGTPPLIQIALIHHQFEAIHPFLDGNGRVGRLLVTLYLVERGVLPTPLLYLSAFFEATRSDYYERLRAATERGDWENWLVYFLSGVARQSEDAVDRASRIQAKLDGWRLEVAGLGTRVPALVIERLAANPFVTANNLAGQLDVAFSTASRAIDRLVKLGILYQVDERRRDRAYCATAILKILEEPAKLTP